MANLINIGVNGLIAHQSAIATTGNNITNANTPGYSRQRVELATLPEHLVGVGYMGSGVQVTSIARIVEQFTINQLRLDTSNFHSVDIKTSMYNQLDSVLADTSTGLAPAVQQLFASLQQAAQDPTSVEVRQVVLNQAGMLTQRFGSFYSLLEGQHTVLNQQLDALVGQVNSLAGGIAKLNQQIAEASGNGTAQPNALLDQRDEMIRQLAESIGVRAVPDGTGQMNVYIGNGQPLVVGNRANTLAAVPSRDDPSAREIVFSAGNLEQPITRFLGGGRIGGLLEYRNEALLPTMNELGRLALGMADALNRQQQLGLDLDGNFGNALFREVNAPTAMAERAHGLDGNVGAAQLQVHIDDVSRLTGADYRLVFSSATGYQLLDAKGQPVATSIEGSLSNIATDPVTITTAEGFEIRIPAGATISPGDGYRIQPARHGARDMQLALTNPRELALAASLSASASSSNAGTGAIGGVSVVSLREADGSLRQSFATPGSLEPPLLIRFRGATSFEVLDSRTLTVLPGYENVAFTPGQANAVEMDGYRFELSGYPAGGDTFRVDFNVDGSSDNRNAVALGALRLQSMIGGASGAKMTMEQAYGSIVANVGSTTAALKINREAADSLLAQAQASRDAVSGVNLDEEASNLIRFEQAYNASAQVISIARSLFDSLISAVR